VFAPFCEPKHLPSFKLALQELNCVVGEMLGSIVFVEAIKKQGLASY
jgi:hypothetical protein